MAVCRIPPGNDHVCTGLGKRKGYFETYSACRCSDNCKFSSFRGEMVAVLRSDPFNSCTTS